jgi:hypothetical protein
MEPFLFAPVADEMKLLRFKPIVHCKNRFSNFFTAALRIKHF